MHSSDERKSPGNLLKDLSNADGEGICVPEGGCDSIECRMAEKRYFELFNNMLSGVAVYEAVDNGRDFIFKDFNRAAERITGDSREQLIGMSISNSDPVVEKSGLIDGLRRVWNTGQSERLPVVRYMDNKPITWYDNLVYKLPTNEIVSVFEDVTARRQTEEALRKSEETFQKAFRFNASLMGITDIETGVFIAVNEAFLSVLGYTEQEVIGKSTHELNVYADENQRQEIIRLLMENGFVRNFEVRVRTKSGGIRCGLFSVTTITQQGKTFILSQMTDITERKLAEAERLRIEQQMQQAQRLESLGLLAGGIAHDFNNLLSGIFGYIDLAYERATDETVSEYLAKTLATIERARGLTHQLLTFAKGGAPIKQVGALFPFVRETAQFALSGSSVSCTFHISPDLKNCEFDKNQIGQVIDNIVINAQQAMPLGGSIRITAENAYIRRSQHAHLTEGEYVRIAVADTGIGIPAELKMHIFDPFFTTKQKGNGLGLATSYSIMKRHSGTIDVESEPGKGSVFTIYLPAVHDAGREETNAALSTHRGSGRIVLMDDEEFMREVISNMIAAMGYTVVPMRNGDEVLQFFKEEREAFRPLRAFILDLTVQGGSGGKETAEAIRKIDPTIPIFISSGYSDDPVMTRPGDFGLTGSIRKPFRKSELTALFSQYLVSL